MTFGRIKLRKTDVLFSQYIRERDKWTCQKCFKKPERQGLHCSHFWGRANENTRFSPENCVALCFACHQHFTANPALHTEWFKKRLGEKRFKDLRIQANLIKRRDDKLDEIIIKAWLKTLNLSNVQ